MHVSIFPLICLLCLYFRSPFQGILFTKTTPTTIQLTEGWAYWRRCISGWFIHLKSHLTWLSSMHLDQRGQRVQNLEGNWTNSLSRSEWTNQTSSIQSARGFLWQGNTTRMSPPHGELRCSAVFHQTSAKAHWEQSESIFSTKKGPRCCSSVIG